MSHISTSSALQEIEEKREERKRQYFHNTGVLCFCWHCLEKYKIKKRVENWKKLKHSPYKPPLNYHKGILWETIWVLFFSSQFFFAFTGRVLMWSISLATTCGNMNPFAGDDAPANMSTEATTRWCQTSYSTLAAFSSVCHLNTYKHAYMLAPPPAGPSSWILHEDQRVESWPPPGFWPSTSESQVCHLKQTGKKKRLWCMKIK